MLLFGSVFLIAYLGRFIKVNYSKESKKWYLFIVFTILTVAAALRSSTVGTDLRIYYSRYYPMFANASWDSIQRVTVSGHWEWGFCAMCKILGMISTDVRFFIVVTSLISVIPYAIFIYKNSEDVVFSTTFFIGFHIYSMSLNIVRQAIAIGILLLGFEFLKHKRYVFYILFVILASLFHTAALISLILIPIDYLRYRKRTFYLLSILAILFLGGYDVIINRLLNTALISSAYGIYTLGEEHARGFITLHTLGMFAITLYAFVVSTVFYNNNEEEIISRKTVGRRIKIGSHLVINSQQYRINWRNSTLLYASYLAMVLRAIAFFVNVASRMAYYFFPFIMVLIPVTINNIEDRKTRKTIAGIMYASIFIFFWYILVFRAESLWGVLPYSVLK